LNVDQIIDDLSPDKVVGFILEGFYESKEAGCLPVSGDS
jgi:hypothetical protein